jgi:hypothetical protein
MYALTLHQPWAWAIAHGGKRIENRTWTPPKWIIGQRIAIHAGKTLDKEAAEDLLYWRGGGTCFGRHGPAVLEDPPGQYTLGAFVAVATVKGYVTTIGEQHPQAGWFCGPRGWVLDDVVALGEPVPCRGRQKLWVVPGPELEQIEKQLSA